MISFFCRNIFLKHTPLYTEKLRILKYVVQMSNNLWRLMINKNEINIDWCFTPYRTQEYFNYRYSTAGGNRVGHGKTPYYNKSMNDSGDIGEWQIYK